MSTEVKAGKTPLRVLLVDDDIVFGSVMSALAKRYPIELTHVSSVRDAYHLSVTYFDVLLLDYRLGSVTGLQLSRFYEHFQKPNSVFLISAASEIENNDWPACVKGFLSKKLGPRSLIEHILEEREAA